MSIDRAVKEGTDKGVWNNKSNRFTAGPEAKQLSTRVYNIIIGLVIFYGIFVNFIISTVFQKEALAISWPVLFIGYLVLVIVGTLMVNRSRNPLISFIGYNLVVLPIGILVSRILVAYDMGTITTAILVTTIVTGVMLLIATLFPGCFLSLGRVLFVSLLSLIAARFVMSLFFHQYNVRLFDYVGAGIFSVYLGYDWQRANQYARTLDNAIDSACDIYLDIINLFLHLLRIFGNRND